MLANLLFTDIVASTEHVNALADRRWRDLLDRHDGVVRRNVEHLRGRVVTTTGDRALAVFDGPGRAMRCALALREALRDLGIEIRGPACTPARSSCARRARPGASRSTSPRA